MFVNQNFYRSVRLYLQVIALRVTTSNME